MPKLTNKCAICGKPILKSATLCSVCIAKKETRQRELEQQQEIYNVRLQSDLLWEKRRYEIAKDCLAAIIQVRECEVQECWQRDALDDVLRQDVSDWQSVLVDEAVTYADKLIEELKRKK